MTQDISGTIIALEERRRQALLACDVGALSELLSDRLVFAHSNAVYEDKTSLLAKMGSGNIVYLSLEITEQRVMDLGETALLFSRLTAEVTVGGQPRSLDNRTLSVWTREGGQWRLLAYQPIAIPR